MTLHHGDCIDVMAAMDPESVDAIVTDPPYGLEFMGKAWDHGAIGRPFADAMFRVAKPSAYLLAFGGTRTVHRMTCALEDAGWIIRDMLVWGYASGFPKSKASLKPAWEPIVMARKPGPLRMLAIDECRIEGQYETRDRDTEGGASMFGLGAGGGAFVPASGRWPANIVLTDPIFDGGIAGVVGGGEAETHGGQGEWLQHTWAGREPTRQSIEPDTGTYSRFFLVPKAARSDREPVLGGLPLTELRTMGDGIGEYTRHAPGAIQRQNIHPTVKPVELMRHLVRLVTPTGGIVLDPFLGSGTTAIAAEMEGFAWIGIEREAEYVAIAEARLNGTQKGMAL